jgi:hypothetical protein
MRRCAIVLALLAMALPCVEPVSMLIEMIRRSRSSTQQPHRRLVPAAAPPRLPLRADERLLVTSASTG